MATADPSHGAVTVTVVVDPSHGTVTAPCGDHHSERTRVRESPLVPAECHTESEREREPLRERELNGTKFGSGVENK